MTKERLNAHPSATVEMSATNRTTQSKRLRNMGKFTAIAALSAVGRTYADDPHTTTAQRVEFELSNEQQRIEGHHIGFDSVRNLRDNSVFMFNARNLQSKATGAAPRRQPIVTNDQDHQGVPVKKTAIVSGDINAHLLTSHGFQSPYYPNTITHTCVNDNMYPHSYLDDVGYYFSHSVVECCQNHFSQSLDHCTKAVLYEAYQVGEQSSTSLQLMTSPVTGVIPVGKKPMMNHYTELESQPHQESPSWYEGGKSSKLAKTTLSWESTSSSSLRQTCR